MRARQAFREIRTSARTSISRWLRKLGYVVSAPDGMPMPAARAEQGPKAHQEPEPEQSTQTKQASQSGQAPARHQAFTEHIPAVTYVLELDSPSRASYYSRQVEALLGYPRDAYEKNPLFWVEVVHPEDRERVLAADARSSSTGEPFEVEYRCITRDGRTVWVHDKASVALDEGGRPRLRQGLMLDITNRKAFEEQLEHRAFHDPLTELPNRALFMDRLRHALAGLHRSSKVIAVLFMDVDDFKSVNDSLGHEAGDRFLVTIASRLRTCVRPRDTVSRLGGDEFAMLLEDIADASGAARVAQRIISELRAPLNLDEHEVSVGISIGIALGFSARQPEDLLREADLALYEAKRKGKGHYRIFDDPADDRRPGYSVSEAELRRALERGELRVHYQPKIALETGTIAGVEALVRWEHPKRGLLAPKEFMALAEETGMLNSIDRWVLREACYQVADWQERYHYSALTVSVNLSAQSLRDRDQSLLEDVQQVLRETGLDASRLLLEVPESVTVGAEELAVLGELKSTGVRLELEDFGPGELSLSRLGRLPADSLKLDFSSTRATREGSKGKLAASAIVGAAHALGRELVAEGVENGEQLAQLRELGFERAQGRYLVGSIPGDEISSLLARCQS